MSPPKRAIFSVNIESSSESVYQRAENKDHRNEAQHQESTHGTSHVEILTKPFQKEAKRSVERVLDGKIVDQQDGNEYEVGSIESAIEKKKKKGTGKSVKEEFDTSDL
ncbi:hypothetical protein P154DRAFT_580849 [Amniculicola lignicola CBS 123094]|uniref:Uncharacterized protein n=1 Tax=Amniculicola lignicola CBS 123094 TaxID=1392246 RepID=A0A6A5W130_9PLEO|nr:hypothetical protein P154DRAFT_580849 [Amniculicola lignicola CBS 123094]